MDYQKHEAHAFQTIAAAQLPPVSPVEKQWKANEVAHGVFDQICRLADRLAGPQPETVSGGIKAGGGSLFADIDIGADRLLERANDADRAISRINRLIPGGL